MYSHQVGVVITTRCPPILAILKQAEAGTPVPELCREYGISSATFHKRCAEYGGHGRFAHVSSEEEENRRLKMMYAEER